MPDAQVCLADLQICVVPSICTCIQVAAVQGLWLRPGPLQVLVNAT